MRSQSKPGDPLNALTGAVSGWLRVMLRVIALGLGAAHTTVAILQQSMNEDGIVYLDMGAAFLRGDWAVAINGIWSPLYGVLAAGVLRLEPWRLRVFPGTVFFRQGGEVLTWQAPEA